MRSTFWTPLAAGDSNEPICARGDRRCCDGKGCRVRVKGALLFCIVGSRTAFLTWDFSVKAECRQERAMRTPEGHTPGQDTITAEPPAPLWVTHPAFPSTALGLLRFNPSLPAASCQPSNILEHAPLTKTNLEVLPDCSPPACLLLPFLSPLTCCPLHPSPSLSHLLPGPPPPLSCFWEIPHPYSQGPCLQHHLLPCHASHLPENL